MRRRYGAAYFGERVERVLAAMPDAAVGTDLIAGFPGETAGQFEQYFNFVESLPLAYFHVFPYSARPYTTAAKLQGQVPAAEVRRRAAMLRDLGEHKRRQFAAGLVGKKLKVLLEETTRAGWLRGYSRNYVPVLTQGSPDLTNSEVEVEATFAQNSQLVGRLVQTPAAAPSGPPRITV
jgi:threonylcarbamoyladenosine tRNA methylthiotransferase MtaB